MGKGRSQEAASEALALAGRGVLREMAALASFVDHPWENANRLEDRVREFVHPDRCAQMMVESLNGSALLDECSADVRSKGHAATMLQALVGAHFLEAGAFAASQFWTWLTNRGELESALMHMDTPRFAGRTDTYLELWELNSERDVPIRI